MADWKQVAVTPMYEVDCLRDTRLQSVSATHKFEEELSIFISHFFDGLEEDLFLLPSFIAKTTNICIELS